MTAPLQHHNYMQALIGHIKTTGDSGLIPAVRKSFPTLIRNADIDFHMAGSGNGGAGHYRAIIGFGNHLWIAKHDSGKPSFLGYVINEKGVVVRNTPTDYEFGNDDERAYSAMSHGNRGWIYTTEDGTYRLRCVEYNTSTHAISHTSSKDFTMDDFDDDNDEYRAIGMNGSRAWVSSSESQELESYKVSSSGDLTRDSSSDFDYSTLTDENISGGIIVDNRIWLIVPGENKLISVDILPDGTLSHTSLNFDDHDLPDDEDDYYRNGVTSGGWVWVLNDSEDRIRGYVRDDPADELEYHTAQQANTSIYNHDTNISKTWDGAISLGVNYWMVNREDDLIRGYRYTESSSNFSHKTDLDHTFSDDNMDLRGGCAIGDTIFVLDAGDDRKFKALVVGTNDDGNDAIERQSEDDWDLPGDWSARGVIGYKDYIYVCDQTNELLRCYKKLSTGWSERTSRQYDYSSITDNSWVAGGFAAGDRIYIIASDDQELKALNLGTNGRLYHDSDADIDLDHSKGTYRGAAVLVNGTRAYLVNSKSNRLEKYDIRNSDLIYPTISRDGDETLASHDFKAIWSTSHDRAYVVSEESTGYKMRGYRLKSDGGFERKSSSDTDTLGEDGDTVLGAFGIDQIGWVLFSPRTLKAFYLDVEDDHTPKRHSASDHTISGLDSYRGCITWRDNVYIANLTQYRLEGYGVVNGILTRDDDLDFDYSDITTNDIFGGFTVEARMWIMDNEAKKLYSLDIHENGTLTRSVDTDDYTFDYSGEQAFNGGISRRNHAWLLDDKANKTRNFKQDGT